MAITPIERAITSPEVAEAISSPEVVIPAQAVETTGVKQAVLPSVVDIRREVDAALAEVLPATLPTAEEAQPEEPQINEQPAKTDKPEKARKPKFTLREATIDDIDAIVDVDMRSFDSVYSSYGQTQEELRKELHDKFLGRFEKVGGYWMPVLERDGKIVGFMTCCPTSKTPEEFESWEKTTDNGTLETTYDPDGKNLYVVTLSVLPEGSAGKDMLYGNQIAKVLVSGFDQAFFESRLPGLRGWVLKNKCEGSEVLLDALTPELQEAYANEYFELKTESKGRQVRQDKLVRLYERIGCKPVKVAPNAYQDKPSMDFGVVFTYDGRSLFDGSDLPVKLPDNRATRWMFGKLLQLASHSVTITGKLFA